ncbi:MAG: hypothetical protein Q4C95_09040 [Planctomycetia bacterium]|nr:hypothetical protein [Planctomycetia bacterium]
MKKYLILWAVALLFYYPAVQAADFGDLLTRLDSRDFSAEKDVVTGKGGVYVGELTNPHEDTPMFKARDEFRRYLEEARTSEEKATELTAFILDSLKSDVSVETKVWLFEQLSIIGTDNEASAVAPFLTNEERRIVDAAAACLAKIPGEAALDILNQNREIPAAAAALTCRTAPIFPAQSVESEFPLALSNASQEEVDNWLNDYDKFSDWDKARTLAGLTARNDKQYRDFAIKAFNSEIERDGFLALEKMATADDVALFVSWLQKDRNLAIRLAGFVVADGFDEALLTSFDQATDSQLFSDLATILANRAVDVRSHIFKKTTATVCDNRLELMRKVCSIATVEDVPQLILTVTRFPRGKDHDAAENLVAALCNKDATPILALRDKYPDAVLFPVASRTGGDAAKAAIEKALDSENPVERAAGLNALNVWADAQFADKMESLIVSGKLLSDGQKIALLRAYIRVVSLPDDQIGVEMSKDDKLANLKKAFAFAKRADEKKLILSRLAANRTDKSLEFAIQCAADADLAEAAYSAIADHAHDTAIRKQFPDLVIQAINLVIEKSQNEELVERVKIYKGRME